MRGLHDIAYGIAAIVILTASGTVGYMYLEGYRPMEKPFPVGLGKALFSIGPTPFRFTSAPELARKYLDQVKATPAPTSTLTKTGGTVKAPQKNYPKD